MGPDGMACQLGPDDFMGNMRPGSGEKLREEAWQGPRLEQVGSTGTCDQNSGQYPKGPTEVPPLSLTPPGHE